MPIRSMWQINSTGKRLFKVVGRVLTIGGIELVLHRMPDPKTGKVSPTRGLWAVSDPVTGTYIAKEELTKESAISSAIAVVEMNGGADGLAKAREKWRVHRAKRKAAMVEKARVIH